APIHAPDDEWQAISLNYTSGTPGNPKGVVYHHRGAYLSAFGQAVMSGLQPESVYLWTVPMFHCNGWCYTWAVTLVGATHVVQRAVVVAEIFDKIERLEVTHLAGAPTVLNMLAFAPGQRPSPPGTFRPDRHGWRAAQQRRHRRDGADGL